MRGLIAAGLRALGAAFTGPKALAQAATSSGERTSKGSSDRGRTDKSSTVEPSIGSSAATLQNTIVDKTTHIDDTAATTTGSDSPSSPAPAPAAIATPGSSGPLLPIHQSARSIISQLPSLSGDLENGGDRSPEEVSMPDATLAFQKPGTSGLASKNNAAASAKPLSRSAAKWGAFPFSPDQHVPEKAPPKSPPESGSPAPAIVTSVHSRTSAIPSPAARKTINVPLSLADTSNLPAAASDLEDNDAKIECPYTIPRPDTGSGSSDGEVRSKILIQAVSAAPSSGEVSKKPHTEPAEDATAAYIKKFVQRNSLISGPSVAAIAAATRATISPSAMPRSDAYVNKAESIEVAPGTHLGIAEQNNEPSVPNVGSPPGDPLSTELVLALQARVNSIKQEMERQMQSVRSELHKVSSELQAMKLGQRVPLSEPPAADLVVDNSPSSLPTQDESSSVVMCADEEFQQRAGGSTLGTGTPGKPAATVPAPVSTHGRTIKRRYAKLESPAPHTGAKTVDMLAKELEQLVADVQGAHAELRRTHRMKLEADTARKDAMAANNIAIRRAAMGFHTLEQAKRAAGDTSPTQRPLIPAWAFQATASATSEHKASPVIGDASQPTVPQLKPRYTIRTDASGLDMTLAAALDADPSKVSALPADALAVPVSVAWRALHGVEPDKMDLRLLRHSSIIEAFAVWAALVRWAELFKGTTVTCHTDSRPVIHHLEDRKEQTSPGRPGNKPTPMMRVLNSAAMKRIRNSVNQLKADYSIELEFVWVPRTRNALADKLSHCAPAETARRATLDTVILAQLENSDIFFDVLSAQASSPSGASSTVDIPIDDSPTDTSASGREVVV